MANGKLIPVVGDIVTLASGGPPMTVERLENAPVSATPLAPGATPEVLVKCVWFNPAGAFAQGVFNAAVLVEASGSSAPPASSPPVVS